MRFNKKIIISMGLLSVVAFAATASMEPKPEEYKNLKVLPKHIAPEQLHGVMGDWSRSLGVRCNFCHVRNEETKKMDFANDAKPEKEMARQMFKMMGKINKKFFHAGKELNGMIAESGVNCYTCHRGSAHPPEPKAGIPDDRKGPAPAAAASSAPATASPEAGNKQ
jgi:nitrate/TMAO reductase-like tetraheme cytochrome c subunit